MAEKLKKHETIGACGIDCGLCPRYYTKGSSTCPGCGGINFRDRHPSCGILTCCVIKHGYETCSDCPDFPCHRFDSEKNGYDSFVTHKKIFVNIESIRKEGIAIFLEKQKECMDILNHLLAHYDDGRSKSFYCLSCALLPIDKLWETQAFAESLKDDLVLKEKAEKLKEALTEIADSLNIKLRLRKNK